MTKTPKTLIASLTGLMIEQIPTKIIDIHQSIDKGKPTRMVMSQSYLRTYFAERNLANDIITVEHKGNTHIIEGHAIIDMILQAPAHEQAQIANTIRKIEWTAPSAINGFIVHLANCYIETNF